MAWRILTYRFDADNSRHRVAVWRELRRVGAVGLQAATWAVPAGEELEAGLARAVALVQRAGGQAIVLDVDPASGGVGVLEGLYSAERDEEWAEFVAECGKASAELAAEVAKEKFTLAELEEEERNVDRLRRWYRDLRAKDLFGAVGAAEGERCLKDVLEALEDFAGRVYEARHRS